MIALKICLTSAILAYFCMKNTDEIMEAINGKYNFWHYAACIFGWIMLISGIVAIWQLL